MDDEVPLHGGFSTVVVRSGQTVRRAASPWTPSVHTLLRFLRSRGFEQAPVPLGLDDQEREVLEYVEGAVAWWPWPAALRTDEGLCQVAALVQRLAAVLLAFVEPAEAVWHDSASPAPVGWDAARAALFFVPLRPATGYRSGESAFTGEGCRSGERQGSSRTRPSSRAATSRASSRTRPSSPPAPSSCCGRWRS